jgi:hypothetical protein
MKIKTTIAVLAGLVVAVNAFAQGQVTFNNTPSQPVVDSSTGMAATPGVAIAGLYYATDLGAVPDTSVPLDGFTLAATTIVAPNAIFVGTYNGGTVTIPGTAEGQAVLLQVRAWSAAFSSYEAAMTAGAPNLAGASNLMNVNLGGGSIPIPALSTRVLSFTITPVPEPSTVVLGLLGGLGAMVLLRRRK